MNTFDWIKIGSLLVSILVSFWAIVQFIISRKIEAKKPYLEYQLSLYQKTVRLASLIGIEEDQSKRKDYIFEFKSLYYGELALVESPEVTEKLIEFYNSVRDDHDDIRHKSLELAELIRNALSDSWNVKSWSTRRAKSLTISSSKDAASGAA